MPFPLISVGVARSAPGVKIFTTVHKMIAITADLTWNPRESGRWSVETPGVVLYRQSYSTEPAGSGGGGGTVNTNPAWGQHWPRGNYSG